MIVILSSDEETQCISVDRTMGSGDGDGDGDGGDGGSYDSDGSDGGKDGGCGGGCDGGCATTCGDGDGGDEESQCISAEGTMGRVVMEEEAGVGVWPSD